MLYTSCQASKLLKKLNEDRTALLTQENRSRSFIAASSEDIESLRPEYDYIATQKKIDDFDVKIRTIRHAINVFNSTHEVEGTGMTIDQVLIAMPMLREKKEKLYRMKERLPKVRARSGGLGNNIIEYDYVNYDIRDVVKDYEEASTQLTKLQIALDRTNNTDQFEIDVVYEG